MLTNAINSFCSISGISWYAVASSLLINCWSFLLLRGGILADFSCPKTVSALLSLIQNGYG